MSLTRKRLGHVLVYCSLSIFPTFLHASWTVDMSAAAAHLGGPRRYYFHTLAEAQRFANANSGYGARLLPGGSDDVIPPTPTPDRRTPNEKEFADWFDHGTRAYNDGNYDHASACFRRSLELDPYNKRARSMYAKAAYRFATQLMIHRHFEGGLSWFKIAQTYNSDDADGAKIDDCIIWAQDEIDLEHAEAKEKADAVAKEQAAYEKAIADAKLQKEAEERQRIADAREIWQHMQAFGQKLSAPSQGVDIYGVNSGATQGLMPTDFFPNTGFTESAELTAADFNPEVRAKIVLDFKSLLNDPSSQPTAIIAPIQSGPDQRSILRYADVINQFDVKHSPRYKPKPRPNRKTYCNYFVQDVADAMHVYLPKNMIVNETVEWLHGEGKNTGGWRRVDARMAQEMADGGHLSLAIWKNPEAPDPNAHGHVAVIRPGSPGDPRGDATAQAGGEDENAIHIEDSFPGIDGVEYWCHL